MGIASLSRALRRTLLRLRDGDGPTDGHLLERFVAQHDQAAFEELVGRHGPMVLRVCRRVLLNHHDAEDAMQATFIVLARKASAITKQNSVASWLHGVAYRIACKARVQASRRHSREKPIPDALFVNADSGRTCQDASLVLDEELGRLPEKYRAPLVLCYLQGKTNHETAALLGWPVGSVFGRLARARELLRDRLSRRGVALSAALAALTAQGANAGAMSPALHSVVASATLLAAGKSVPVGLFSPNACTLAAEAMRTLATGKVKAMIALTTLAAAILVGTGIFWLSTPAGPSAAIRFGVPGQGGHKGPIGALRVSPDGTVLATGGGDGAVKLWDLPSGKLLASLPGHQNEVRSIVFTPDSKMLATSTHGEPVRLWDVATAREKGVCLGSEARSGVFLAFDAPGKTLATASWEGEVALWDVGSCRRLATMPWPRELGKPPLAAISSVGFCAGGKSLAIVAYDHGLHVWDVSANRTTRVATPVSNYNLSAVSTDGRTLALVPYRGQSVTIFDTVAGKERRSLRACPDRKEYVAFVALSPDGNKLITASSLQTVKSCDLDTGNHAGIISQEEGYLTALAFFPDGKRLVVARSRAFESESTIEVIDLTRLAAR